MIQDESENFVDTIMFLDNRFENLKEFNQIKNKVIQDKDSSYNKSYETKSLSNIL